MSMTMSHILPQRIDPRLMISMRERTFNQMRRKGRNERMIWLLQKVLRWSVVEVSVENISRAGGGEPKNLDAVFENCDRGVNTMKTWCADQCSTRWRYEPTGTFMFRSMKDAALFKLRWL